MKLRFYEIDKGYLNELRKIENKIMNIEKAKDRRPHIGIILKINDYYYFAPLSSPKSKHKNLKNSLDLIKIDGGELGVINLNNMFPVKKEFFFIKEVEKEKDIKYKILLKKQLEWCNMEKNKDNILKKGAKLYEEITLKKEKSRFWSRTCNFSLLEMKSDRLLTDKKYEAYKIKFENEENFIIYNEEMKKLAIKENIPENILHKYIISNHLEENLEEKEKLNKEVKLYFVENYKDTMTALLKYKNFESKVVKLSEKYFQKEKKMERER